MLRVRLQAVVGMQLGGWLAASPRSKGEQASFLTYAPAFACVLMHSDHHASVVMNERVKLISATGVHRKYS